MPWKRWRSLYIRYSCVIATLKAPLWEDSGEGPMSWALGHCSVHPLSLRHYAGSGPGAAMWLIFPVRRTPWIWVAVKSTAWTATLAQAGGLNQELSTVSNVGSESWQLWIAVFFQFVAGVSANALDPALTRHTVWRMQMAPSVIHPSVGVQLGWLGCAWKGQVLCDTLSLGYLIQAPLIIDPGVQECWLST